MRLLPRLQQLTRHHLRFYHSHRGLQTPTMSSFSLPDTNPPVPVHLTRDLSQTQLLSFPAFKIWLSTLNHSLAKQRLNPAHEFHGAPYSLRSINIQAIDFFSANRLGFVKLKADVSNDDGEKLPGSVFLRGGSVGILVSLSYSLFLFLRELYLHRNERETKKRLCNDSFFYSSCALEGLRRITF